MKRIKRRRGAPNVLPGVRWVEANRWRGPVEMPLGPWRQRSRPTWRCKLCGEWNGDSRTYCRTCRTPRQSVA